MLWWVNLIEYISPINAGTKKVKKIKPNSKKLLLLLIKFVITRVISSTARKIIILKVILRKTNTSNLWKSNFSHEIIVVIEARMNTKIEIIRLLVVNVLAIVIIGERRS